MECTGAQILLESLKREGVDVLFGYPGGAVIDIYDELPRHPEIRHVLVRHEQGAVHAADGYARASGKVGACLVTSGPGATNTVTGIATAYSDSIPLVVVTGQVPTKLIGNDAFQEVDIVGITRPCTKHNFLVKDVNKLALTIRQAFYLARSGRPGPVLVDLPKDVVQARAEFTWPEDIYMRSYNPTYKPNLNQLRRTVEELAQAKRPVLLAGGGVIMANAAEELTALARRLHIPVACTLMGLGGFPATDPLSLGMVGMHGTYAANLAINNADLLVCVGARFDDRVTGKLTAFAPKARIVHIDIDPTSIRKNVAVEVPVVGDCKQALAGIMEICEAKLSGKDWAAEHAEWVRAVAEWKESKPLSYQKNGNIKPQQVVEALRELTRGDAIIATEVGQHQMWAAQFYSFTKPRTLLTSGGLGTMGYGFPAAIGAQFALPDKMVIAVAGDASLQMNIQELATAVAYKLPVKVVILNNRHLGMVRQWQELFYNHNYSSTNMEAQPDFVKLAEAYGAEGYRIEKPEDLLPELEKALATPNPAFIDVVVEREENVYPIVPAGAALDEMLLV
ncbi:biosynthetic-type acetolactate synthase large subunit [Desulfovibrio sp. PG-178-WT-4]|uniref:Acetolactate synthase n=1 Tax=Desulfovibrio porci TaxID=2605782 RepID=A0A6L5XMT7_9BACT|nr:biosynthetic-type acetolactate synthase large subunit [Desulfovibrio porci]MDY3809226.1 biosynthetic-type acetolactate synthase large subunit [Desulfovibrio porci]MSS28425.1 biosynthetic-type acetolactate synthase large subunit [Desulfovibrio porci]